MVLSWQTILDMTFVDAAEGDLSFDEDGSTSILKRRTEVLSRTA